MTDSSAKGAIGSVVSKILNATRWKGDGDVEVMQAVAAASVDD